MNKTRHYPDGSGLSKRRQRKKRKLELIAQAKSAAGNALCDASKALEGYQTPAEKHHKRLRNYSVKQLGIYCRAHKALARVKKIMRATP